MKPHKEPGKKASKDERISWLFLVADKYRTVSRTDVTATRDNRQHEYEAGLIRFAFLVYCYIFKGSRAEV
jgi:hypothetical protein